MSTEETHFCFIYFWY